MQVYLYVCIRKKTFAENFLKTYLTLCLFITPRNAPTIQTTR